MVPICGVCNSADSKYKCPVCELRYCSIPCYKTHKPTHESAKSESKTEGGNQNQQAKVDRPGTTQRVAKLDFTGFENDKDFQHLLSRFPLLKSQLQLGYGVTLEPGPDDTSRWNVQDWYPESHGSKRGGFHDRGRGRGRGRGGFGGGRGGHLFAEIPPEQRQRGQWTQEKGDKQGANILSKMRRSANEEQADGMNEFIELCQIKFGR